MAKNSSRSSSIAAIKRRRTARLAKLATRAYYLHKKGRDAEMGHLLCEEFVSLGGVYIKFMQGVMLQSKIMKNWQNPDRLKIFENVDSEPLDIIGILRHELPSEKLKQIALVQPQPFAAGSFGQVYYGQHINGKPIIIKVLRPMIQELLKYDLRLISRFTKSFFLRLQSNLDINLDTAMKEFRDATLRETDYISEADFAAEMYAAYKDHPTFVIPETFRELCTSNIIVQEYVEGMSAAQLLKLQEQGVEPKQYVKEMFGSDLDVQLTTLGTELLFGIFDLPRIQGDPHPGNIHFMKDNKVGLIDFGIFARSPADRGAFFGLIQEWSRLYKDSQNITALFEQFMRVFVSDLYRALKRLSSFLQNPASQKNFAREVGKIAQENFSNIAGTQDIKPFLISGKFIQMVNRMINKNNRFGLVVRIEASEILRGAQTYMTLAEALGRSHVVLPRVFANVVSRVQEEHPELIHSSEDNISVSDALETVSGWLERVAERDPTLFRELTNRIRLSSKAPVGKEISKAS
jgi:predicted unusual protein kinase regulating ubiquinone biosynthesis (AarF/ABC1/UbiB family)